MGRGFIGAHFVDWLLGEGGANASPSTTTLVGREWHVGRRIGTIRAFDVVPATWKDLPALRGAMETPSRRRPFTWRVQSRHRRGGDPAGHRLLGGHRPHPEPAGGLRGHGVRGCIYARAAASTATSVTAMTRGPTARYCRSRPTAPASSACEALICSYCHMFGLAACAFPLRQRRRTAQTHGVGLRLRPPAARRPSHLRDPRRRHAEQVLHPRRRRRRRVMLLTTERRTASTCTTSARATTITVSEIADLVVECARARRACASTTPAATRLEGRRARRALGDGPDRGRGWTCRTRPARRCAGSIRWP